ncbi:hypothetical protein LWI29_014769 [Acer saccharum]|uniref:CCHC-type domain-containing protein n=1 Tax=Acer saccharum TaxID=4024 RepID=A0AA39TC04_ACESA|nr:hypothetical protein LWI29_014769 [Acer saccharum]
MPVQYERLPSFCFRCGLLGHTVRGCPEGVGQNLINSNDLLYGAWMRAVAPTKLVGNREWNLWYNSESGDEGSTGARRKIRQQPFGGWLAETSERKVRGVSNSNSNSVLDRNLERESGDNLSNRRDKLGSENGQAVIGKEITISELAIENLTFTDGGLGSQGIFVFGSTTDKEPCDGPPDADHSGPGDGNTLGLSGLRPTILKGSTSGNIIKVMGVEECIGPSCVDTSACTPDGGNGKRVGQWKKAARKNPGGVGNSNLKVSCGKRNEVGTVECFTGGNKRPKYDSSASVSTVSSAGQQPLARRPQ